MKADRLVALVLLLQQHGRLSASFLAEQLEVSERTIYRDVDSLSAAGVPVFTQRGPGGGVELLDSYRLDLSGLNAHEIQALLNLSVPAPLALLGVGHDLQSAIRKLAAASAQAERAGHMHIWEKIHVDESEWRRTTYKPLLFETIRAALWENQELAICYYSELGPRTGPISALVQPRGLVAQAGEWYLVAGRDTATIVVPVGRLVTAERTGNSFLQPPDFDLAGFWRLRQERQLRHQPEFLVLARVLETAITGLQDCLVTNPEVAYKRHYYLAHLRFATFEEARVRLLSLGAAVEVIEPLALRLSIADFARQITALYDHDKIDTSGDSRHG